MADRGYIEGVLSGLPQWQALVEAPLAAAASVGGRLVFANRAFLDLTRWSAEELTRDQWLPIMFPDGQEQQIVQREVEQLYAVNEVLRHRPTVTCGDGLRRVMDWTTTAITMPDGKRGLMTIAVDRSSATSPVGNGERGFEELVEDAPDIIFRVDAIAGRILYVNRAIERLTGYAPDEFYQDAGLFPRMILPEHRPNWDASFSRMQEVASRTFDRRDRRRSCRCRRARHRAPRPHAGWSCERDARRFVTWLSALRPVPVDGLRARVRMP